MPALGLDAVPVAERGLLGSADDGQARAEVVTELNVTEIKLYAIVIIENSQHFVPIDKGQRDEIAGAVCPLLRVDEDSVQLGRSENQDSLLLYS